jgi:hypothetical protein
MQVGKKCNGESFFRAGCVHISKTSMSSNRCSGAADDCGALERRILRTSCDVFRRYQKSRRPAGSLTLASAELIGFVFEHRFDLIPKLWAILVSMRRNRMLHSRIEHLIFGTGNLQ